MKLVMGLGNPGEHYKLTRHNIGFLIVDKVAQKSNLPFSKPRFHSSVGEGSIAGQRVVIAKPLTYMNLCGEAAKKLLSYFEVDRRALVVVHDDLDLEFGRIRIKEKGGHGGHNGVRSIISALGFDDFIRLKVGIGRPTGSQKVTDYVLSPFDSEQRVLLSDLMDLAGKALISIITQDVHVAMNEFNQQNCETYEAVMEK